MPDSIREQALAAFFNLFSGLTQFRYKRRLIPNQLIEAEVLPALIQVDGGSSPLAGDDVSSGASGVVRVALRVSVAVVVESVLGDPQDLSKALSKARSEVLAAVYANPTLSGLVWHVKWEGDEDPLPMSEEGAPPSGLYTMNFVIIHTEAELDPFSAM